VKGKKDAGANQMPTLKLKCDHRTGTLKMREWNLWHEMAPVQTVDYSFFRQQMTMKTSLHFK